MEYGTFVGTTDGDALARIGWRHHSTAPKSVLVNRLKNSVNNESDISVMRIVPYLWFVRDDSAYVRFRNELEDKWATNYKVAFTWAAFW